MTRGSGNRSLQNGESFLPWTAKKFSALAFGGYLVVAVGGALALVWGYDFVRVLTAVGVLSIVVLFWSRGESSSPDDSRVIQIIKPLQRLLFPRRARKETLSGWDEIRIPFKESQLTPAQRKAIMTGVDWMVSEESYNHESHHFSTKEHTMALIQEMFEPEEVMEVRIHQEDLPEEEWKRQKAAERIEILLDTFPDEDIVIM